VAKITNDAREEEMEENMQQVNTAFATTYVLHCLLGCFLLSEAQPQNAIVTPPPIWKRLQAS
jgi:hypothetical protein